MDRLLQNLQRRKRKTTVVPPRGFTWEGVLESATMELEKVKRSGDVRRCSELRESARIARKNIQAGKPFPVSPASTRKCVSTQISVVGPFGDPLPKFPPSTIKSVSWSNDQKPK
jgi:hypothetical protein